MNEPLKISVSTTVKETLLQQLWLAKGCGRRCDICIEKVVTRHPEILGGEPVFAGTRVPIKSLFDHLEPVTVSEIFSKVFPA
jgi:hypothetical protein